MIALQMRSCTSAISTALAEAWRGRRISMPSRALLRLSDGLSAGGVIANPVEQLSAFSFGHTGEIPYRHRIRGYLRRDHRHVRQDGFGRIEQQTLGRRRKSGLRRRPGMTGCTTQGDDALNRFEVRYRWVCGGR